MSNRLKVTLLALIVAGGAGWYAFRPERLFINQKVNEQFPTASATNNQLASGEFHNGAHETKGMAAVFQLADGKKTLVGTVNANREYFEMGVKDLAQAEADYPGWLSRLLTHPVRGLENFEELFAKPTNPKGAIKVYCEVAEI